MKKFLGLLVLVLLVSSCSEEVPSTKTADDLIKKSKIYESKIR